MNSDIPQRHPEEASTAAAKNQAADDPQDLAQEMPAAVNGGTGRERSWPRSLAAAGCWLLGESGVAQSGRRPNAAVPTMGQILMAPTVATTQAAAVKNAVRVVRHLRRVTGLSARPGRWLVAWERSIRLRGRPCWIDRRRSDRGRRTVCRGPGFSPLAEPGRR